MSFCPQLSDHSRHRLILFGRYPTPGQTKTRLIPLLGEVGAAEWHRCRVERSLAAIMESCSAYSTVFCYTGADQARVRRWLGHPSLHLVQQRGGDLGDRMRTALFDALDNGCQRAVLVGTDIPHMTPDHIEAAFHALDRCDVVLGPSRDGGYWLVGMRRKIDIFQGIEWGSGEVLNKTLSAIRCIGGSVECLERLNDIDTPSDLQSDPSWKGEAGPFLSVIIPTLNEAGTIESAIQRVHSSESEIIVVDGGSTDQTVHIARNAGAVVLTGRQGRAVQQNAGAAAARGQVLLFLHADTLLPPDYAVQVFETLMDHRVVAGAFQFKTDFDTPGMRLIEKAVYIRSSLFQLPYGDQGLFVPKTIFKQAGGFPLTPIAEDLYLVRRLRRFGRIGLAPIAALTSGRRWRRIGVWRATCVNYLIAIGCLLSVDPHRLAPLYRLWLNNRSPKNMNIPDGNP